jgi:amino acid adenylation domain-containing protein
LIEQQAASTPDAVAVRCGAQVLRYGELNRLANQLADWLIERGARAGMPVALMAQRKPHWLVGWLAIQKSGACYLPIDPDYPPARIGAMLSDAWAPILLTDRISSARLPPISGTTLLLDDAGAELAHRPVDTIEPRCSSADPLYLIYTSGSTGVPKGALVAQAGALNLYRDYIQQLGLDGSRRFLIVSSMGFDLTQKNLFCPLMVGGCVVFPESPVFDPEMLLDTIEQQGITNLNCTPSAFHALIGDGGESTWRRLRGLRQVALGGEPVDLARLAQWRAQCPATDLINGYGPTECSAVVSMAILRAGEPAPKVLGIGRPIANVRLSVRDAALKPLAAGEVGELCVSGVAVGLGYLHRAELTAERFVDDPDNPGARLYRTGDQARALYDGSFEFVGRVDGQVKLRGFRIELGEIESALAALPAVVSAACAVDAREGREARLVAAVVLRSEAQADAESLRHALAHSLPDYMLPSTFCFVDRLPLNAHGKLDRAALSLGLAPRPTLSAGFVAARDDFEAAICALWAEVLDLENVGVDDPFFELGGTSLAAVACVGRMAQQLGTRLNVADFFAASTPRTWASALRRSHAEATTARFGALAGPAPERRRQRGRRAASSKNVSIAIVGMAARLPGADDVDAFWRNLVDGVESIVPLSEPDLDEAGVAAVLRNDPHYVRMSATMAHADCFDAAFFGVTPREASIMDPQQRVLLECAWSALEHAGYDPAAASGAEGPLSTGVFAGVARNSYFSHNLANDPATRAQLGEVQVTFANDKDYAATRVAHKLGLNGPAITAQTACSTGGVLLHLARRSLQAGECDMALVGGARVVSPLKAGYPWVEGSIFSRDGHMRVFDEHGTGMVRGSGVVCLVLKRLDDAERDGDTVYALLAGSALNNDGADKAGYTAPSVSGQAEVIGLALDDAGVSADAISYVEAHGTATALGDPIEVSALTRAFRDHGHAARQTCRIGSVKSNVGHLDPAAALASTLKVALSLQHRLIPASLGFESPNPQIDFANSPFTVAAKAVAWDADSPRHAGVSSFGIGGTNAHLILREAPLAPASAAPGRTWQLLPLSAKTEPSLQTGAGKLGQWFAHHTQPESTAQQSQFTDRAGSASVGDALLADAAWTLQVGRSRFAQRAAVVVQSRDDAARALQSPERWIRGTALADPEIVFVFPGQGAQHPGMGRALYDGEPVYRGIIDHGCEFLRPLLDVDLRALLLASPGDAAAAQELRQTRLAQPAIYLVSYAQARLLASLGVEPKQMIGHSIGEFVAATLAGVFAFEDALTLLVTRARLMQSMDSGSMLAVRLPEAELRPLLPGDIDVAAINAPGATIVAGPDAAVAAFDSSLKTRGIGTAALHTSHAFHSAMMEPVVAPLAAAVAAVERQEPRRPIISTVTGQPLSAEQAQDPDYWARQLRQPVRFADAVDSALTQSGALQARVFVEVGPGQSLSGPLRQIIAARSATQRASAISASPPAAAEQASAAEQLQVALAQLWIAGCDLDWSRLHGAPRRRVGMPGYAFARVRHWIEPQSGSLPSAEAVSESVLPAESTVAANAPADPLRERVVKLLATITGIEFTAEDDDRSFLELGMDSLILTQAAGRLKSEFRVDLRFRQLMEELSTLRSLTALLSRHVGPDLPPAPDGNPVPDPAALAEPDSGAPRKAFGAGVRINRSPIEALSDRQRKALEALSARYLARTPGSKASAQQHRRYFADPRTVSGFKPLWKELVYPIVSTRSDGAKLWDVDGNEYIDTVNGFGATLFGHKPPFVDAALREQIERGYEVGPVQDYVGEAARLFCELTRNERVAFCNTGSEAVSAAVRCARTVTGRDLVVSFNHDYHGIQDEVIVRPGRDGRGVPAASGIPFSNTASTLILEYGDPRSLEVIEARRHEIAAVLVEPVQSRNMDLQPRDFLHAARKLADAGEYALIFDEVITGFRCAQGGAQQHFGVQADIATYGKVFGGGMPVGAVAGKALFLDALDGGFWQYGDESVPEAGVTYFAGTFVRHPMVMAAVFASLRHLQAHPNLQADLNARIGDFVRRLHALTAQLQAPLRFPHFASAFRLEWTQEEPFSELFAVYLLERGLHTYDGRVQIMTTAHDDAVLDRVYAIFADALQSMQRDGLLGRVGEPAVTGLDPLAAGGIFYRPPVEGARLGRDANGIPAWFIADESRPGRYLQLEPRT